MAPEIEERKNECYGEELREKLLEFAEGESPAPTVADGTPISVDD